MTDSRRPLAKQVQQAKEYTEQENQKQRLEDVEVSVEFALTRLWTVQFYLEKELPALIERIEQIEQRLSALEAKNNK